MRALNPGLNPEASRALGEWGRKRERARLGACSVGAWAYGTQGASGAVKSCPQARALPMAWEGSSSGVASALWACAPKRSI